MHIPDRGSKPRAVAAVVIPVLCSAADCTSYGKCHCLCSQCAVMVPGKRFSHRNIQNREAVSRLCFPRSHTSTHAHTHTIRARTHPEGVEFYLWGSILCLPSQTLILFLLVFFFFVSTHTNVCAEGWCECGGGEWFRLLGSAVQPCVSHVSVCQSGIVRRNKSARFISF